MIQLNRRQFALAVLSWGIDHKCIAAQNATQSVDLSAAVKSKLPKLSDVVFSTRSFRPDAIHQLQAFNATRCEWVYTDNQSFINDIHQYVPHAGLAVRSNPQTAGGRGSAMTIQGRPLIAPWQKKMGFEWGSSLRKPTRDAIEAWTERSIQLGADSIQLDDPNMEFGAAVFDGGDFSNEAIIGFADYAKKISSISSQDLKVLEKNDWDISKWAKSINSGELIVWSDFKRRNFNNSVWQAWRDYLKSTVSLFLISLKQKIQLSSKPVPLSFNISDPFPSSNNAFLLDKPDYWLSEISFNNSSARIAAFSATAEAYNKVLISSLQPAEEHAMRWAIASTYANGGLALAPWDVFVAGVDGDSSRYYGKASDYSDLYLFVRSNKRLLDGWRRLCCVYLMVDTQKFDSTILIDVIEKLQKHGIQFSLLSKTGSVVVGNFDEQFPVIPIGVSRSEIVLWRKNARIISATDVAIAELAAVSMTARPTDTKKYHTSIRHSLGNIAIHVINSSGPNSLGKEQDSVLISIPKEKADSLLLGSPILTSKSGTQRLSLTATTLAGMKTINVPIVEFSEWSIIEISNI